jgi:Outer membrane lipoprotein-sorting protein
LNIHCRPPQLPAPIAGLRGFPCLALLCLLEALVCRAASPVDREAQALVQTLLSQRPAKELSLDGVFKIRHSGGRRTEVAVHYAVRSTPDHWESVYQTAAAPSFGPEHLVVVHRADEQPNRYLFTQISLDGLRTNSMSLTGAEANVSFAGSDFWLTDLGMEFLHWPQQRLVRNAPITMRLGRPCKVLESVNPRPAVGTYRRVVSWIDAELGNLIYAEACDFENQPYKVFSLRGFKRVNGHWQVKEMELRNDKADSRTDLEFNFESE